MNRHLVEQDVQPARSLEEVDPRRTKALLPLSMLGQTDNGLPKRGVGPLKRPRIVTRIPP